MRNPRERKMKKCSGQIIRHICHLSTGDLPEFRIEAGNRTMMANKFDLDVDPVAVVCQAKDIAQRTALYTPGKDGYS